MSMIPVHEQAVARVFFDKLLDLKQGRPAKTQLIMFFADGYWCFPDTDLDKETLYHIHHTLISRIKPRAYAIISDTNMRDPHSHEIIGEQLMAVIIEPGSQTTMMTREYVRTPGGDIEFKGETETNRNVHIGGRMTELFDEPELALIESPELMQSFIEMHERLIEKHKIAYSRMRPN